MAIADALVMEIDQESKTTQRVLDRIPEDKLGWKPHPRSYSLASWRFTSRAPRVFWWMWPARIHLKLAI